MTLCGKKQKGPAPVLIGSGLWLHGVKRRQGEKDEQLLTHITLCAENAKHRLAHTLGEVMIEHGREDAAAGQPCDREYEISMVMSGITPEYFADMTDGVLSFDGGDVVCEWDEAPDACWIGASEKGLVLLDLMCAQPDRLQVRFALTGGNMLHARFMLHQAQDGGVKPLTILWHYDRVIGKPEGEICRIEKTH